MNEINEHPCKKCISYTKDIIETSNKLEVEFDLCGFGIYFKQIPYQQQRCLNYREIINPNIASQSAKPGQAHIPASPCPADTLLNTPPNSRHPGAKDSEVRKHKLNDVI